MIVIWLPIATVLPLASSLLINNRAVLDLKRVTQTTLWRISIWMGLWSLQWSWLYPEYFFSIPFPPWHRHKPCEPCERKLVLNAASPAGFEPLLWGVGNISPCMSLTFQKETRGGEKNWWKRGMNRGRMKVDRFYSRPWQGEKRCDIGKLLQKRHPLFNRPIGERESSIFMPALLNQIRWFWSQ